MAHWNYKTTQRPSNSLRGPPRCGPWLLCLLTTEHSSYKSLHFNYSGHAGSYLRAIASAMALTGMLWFSSVHGCVFLIIMTSIWTSLSQRSHHQLPTCSSQSSLNAPDTLYPITLCDFLCSTYHYLIYPILLFHGGGTLAILFSVSPAHDSTWDKCTNLLN